MLADYPSGCVADDSCEYYQGDSFAAVHTGTFFSQFNETVNCALSGHVNQQVCCPFGSDVAESRVVEEVS